MLQITIFDTKIEYFCCENLPIWDPNFPTKNCRSPYLSPRKDHMYAFSLTVSLFCFIFITTFYTWFSTHFLSQPVHCLSAEIRSLSAHPILSLPRNHAFTIKTSASNLEKPPWTSTLLISALEIHHNFMAFNCLPFCLLFSKPTLTVAFGKYRMCSFKEKGMVCCYIFGQPSYGYLCPLSIFTRIDPMYSNALMWD